MKKLVYLLTKDSTLWAFEGPEEPVQKEEGSFIHFKWKEAMSTARESALPVVNASCMCKYESEALLFYIDKERIKIGPGETVPLPGWALEKLYQWRPYPTQDWQTTNYRYWDNINAKGPTEKRQAYRLKRLEPVCKVCGGKKEVTGLDCDGHELTCECIACKVPEVKEEPIKLTFYSGKLWNSDKPFPVKPIVDDAVFATLEAADYNHEVKSWLSTAYEVVNPEVIPVVAKDREGDFIVLKTTNPKHWDLLSDGDQITLPEGYGIDRDEQFSHCTRDEKHYNKSASITVPEKDYIDANSDQEAWVPDQAGDNIIVNPVVEPSESQEDKRNEIEDLLYSTGKFTTDQATEVAIEILKLMRK